MSVLARCLLFFLFATSAAASLPYQVVDLRAYAPCCAEVRPPLWVGTFGERAFVITGETGGLPVLWSTDGTAGGTALLTNVSDGEASVENFVATGDGLYFAHAWKLWRTDGTIAGTVSMDGLPPVDRPLIAWRGELFFLANDSREVWAIGAGGRRVVVRFAERQSWTDGAAWGDRLIIATESGLWSTDGRAATRIVEAPAWKPVVANERLFFIGKTEEDGGELWISDGTTTGTHLIRNIRRKAESAFFPETTSMTALGDRLLFVTDNGELGVSDGTVAGTYLLRLGQPQQLVSFVPLNGRVLFNYSSTAAGRQLWVSDGTSDGTRRVRAEWDASWESSRYSRSRPPIAAGATRIYYYDTVPLRRRTELFETDGTQEGTRPVQRVRGPPAAGSAGNLVTIGDKVFFSAGDEEHGIEPWVSDGTDEGTHVIADLVRDPGGSSNPAALVAAADRLYFTATSHEGPALWSTDGTASGTAAIPESKGLEPSGAVGKTLFLKSGGRLWKTEAGRATLVHDFGPDGSSIHRTWVVGGRFYLDVFRDDLYASDGTASGTVALHESRIGEVVPFASGAAFVDWSGRVGVTNGSREGTRVISSRDFSGSQRLVSFGGSLLVFDNGLDWEGPGSRGIWRLSGGAGEVTRVTMTGLDDPLPAAMFGEMRTADLGRALLFTVRVAKRFQLWRTDGTSEGTTFVAVLTKSEMESVQQLVSLGDRALFVVRGTLWVSDGTPDGTKELRSFPPGSSVGPMVVADGVAWFTGNDEAHGRELWQSDGTVDGTRLAADVVPGPASSMPGDITRFGDAIYFSATTRESGRELWAYPLPGEPAITVEDVRAAESAGSVAIPVRLTRASNRRIAVDFETADSTAKEGLDYTHTAGTLVFEPGETLQSVVVPLLDDTSPGLMRSVLLNLENANAPIERTVGAAVIEDDDLSADLSLELEAGTEGTWVIRNAGPSAASNVRFCNGVSCYAQEILRAGAFLRRGFAFASQARVLHAEPDPDPSNNHVSIGRAEGGGLYVLPPVVKAGKLAEIRMHATPVSTARMIELTSSDRTIASVPRAIVLAADQKAASLFFLARKPGVVTITAGLPDGVRSVKVRVVAATEAVRIEPSLELAAPGWTLFADSVTAFVRGRTAEGMHPVGSLTVVIDGRPPTSVPVVAGVAHIPVGGIPPGSYTFRLTYSGDERFLEASLQAPMIAWKAEIDVRAERVAHSSEVVLFVRGGRRAPTGTIQYDGSVHALTQLDEITSTATIAVPVGQGSASIQYDGDDWFRAWARADTVYFAEPPPDPTPSRRRRVRR